MNTYSEILEATHLAQIRQIAANSGYDLRIHVGGGQNASCALVPASIGKTFVFPNLEACVYHLLQGERAQDAFEKLTTIDLERAGIA